MRRKKRASVILGDGFPEQAPAIEEPREVVQAPLDEPKPDEPLDYDDDVWIPPHAGTIENMTKDQLGTFAMRNYGKMLDTSQPKAILVSEVRRFYRTGPR